MLTITSDALAALEQTPEWKRWQSGPSGLPARSALDIYRGFVGAQAPSAEELILLLGDNNMGGGVPVSVAEALARITEEHTAVDSPRMIDDGVLEQVASELGLYVYLLVDPRDGRPFYVGKGRGLRYAAHGLEAAEIDGDSTEENSRKHARINELRGLGLEHQVWILRYGLSSTEYTAVEAAAIDLLMSFPVAPCSPDEPRIPLGVPGLLTNKRREEAKGHGARLLDSLIDEYAAPVLATDAPLLLITLNGWNELPDGEVIAGGHRRYGAGYKQEWLVSSRRVESFDEIGQSVSAWWSLSPATVQRRGINHVVAVHRGVTRALFEIVSGSWETVAWDRVDKRGRTIQKAAFSVRTIRDGDLFDSVVGRHGHRVLGRARGAQNSIYYWPR